MIKLFAPPLGTQEREGWDKCFDIPKKDRNKHLQAVCALLNGAEPGLHNFARGWLDAYQTIKEG